MFSIADEADARRAGENHLRVLYLAVEHQQGQAAADGFRDAWQGCLITRTMLAGFRIEHHEDIQPRQRLRGQVAHRNCGVAEEFDGLGQGFLAGQTAHVVVTDPRRRGEGLVAERELRAVVDRSHGDLEGLGRGQVAAAFIAHGQDHLGLAVLIIAQRHAQVPGVID